MTINSSGFGTSVRIRASVTFPAGFTVTELADDTDPIDVPATDDADVGMGVNADMVAWSKATPGRVNLAVITGGEDDKNLNILLESNRVGRGKLSARDDITMVIFYPDGSSDTYTSGVILNGMRGRSVASAGRFKTRVYGFAFEGRNSA